jgi:hypothetical protein
MRKKQIENMIEKLEKAEQHVKGLVPIKRLIIETYCSNNGGIIEFESWDEMNDYCNKLRVRGGRRMGKIGALRA